MKSFENSVSQAISFVLHPMLMPTYMSMIVFNTDKYLRYGIGGNATWNLVGLIFVLTFLFPATAILILKHFGFVDSLQLKERKERTLPYLITGLFYYFTYHLLSRFSLPGIVYLILIGGSVSVLFTLVINFWWKISAHTMGIGCLVGILIALNMRYALIPYWMIICSLMLGGITGYARLKLNAHTPAQVYSGFLLGLLSLFLLVSLV